MATNPLYNNNDRPNGATQPAKAVNDAQVFVNRNRNTFDLSYFNYKTQRFGQYEPFFVMEGVPGDNIPLHSSHNVRSLPMKSPFLTSLTLSKDYFMVPMQAILPNTWEMIYANPASGDDVPEDANCLFKLFSVASLANFTSEQWAAYGNPTQLKIIMMLESVFSAGSLPAQLGYTMQNTGSNSGTSFDFYFNQCMDALHAQNPTLIFTLPDKSTVHLSAAKVPKGVFVDYLRSNYIYLTDSTSQLNVRSLKDWYTGNEGLFGDWAGQEFNISRILAYQICCKQFYVNTKIDPIYNAQLYRDNFFFLLKQFMSKTAVGTLNYESFTRNGVNVPYDFFSKHYLSKIFAGHSNTEDAISALADIYYYLFSFNRVLKFGDYFTASRTQPLGADVNGQMNAPVVGNEVAAIDMSKSIVMQRFLNNVVKLGNDFGEYLRGIFGREPSPDYHFPKFIAHQEFDVSGFEVANSTEKGQGSMITNLKSGDDRYAFEVSVDMPCIILGISNFNCPRLYGNARPRFLFHKDRFDMFNPMLQYIGDQPVNRGELNTDGTNAEVFGYNSRNAEYKQNFSVASGGFIYKLPSWTFLTEFGPDYAAIPSLHQGTEFLRVYPFEFDRFFATLSGLSLAESFHFIVVYNNKVMASRPMAVNPTIL